MQNATPTMARIDWTGRKFQTSHNPPREALLLDGRSRDGKRRAAIMGDFQTELRRTNPNYDGTTTWFYNDDGTADFDATGVWTLRNVEA